MRDRVEARRSPSSVQHGARLRFLYTPLVVLVVAVVQPLELRQRLGRVLDASGTECCSAMGR